MLNIHNIFSNAILCNDFYDIVMIIEFNIPTVKSIVGVKMSVEESVKRYEWSMDIK